LNIFLAFINRKWCRWFHSPSSASSMCGSRETQFWKTNSWILLVLCNTHSSIWGDTSCHIQLDKGGALDPI
jgi:hypothetical protein